jgi:chromate transporter
VSDDAPEGAREARDLGALALLFLRLGCTAFGGPAAHIAMMESEVVRRRRWLTHEKFLDLLGAANILPGPSSSELCIYIGHERAGACGLFVAGACFILPASLLTALCAWAYLRFGSLPQASFILYGVKPVIIAVVVQALQSLAPKAVKTRKLAAVGAASAAAAALGVEPLAVLGAAGVLALALHRPPRPPPVVPAIAPWLAAAAGAGAVAPFGLVALFLVFLKIGATVFGSGYVLLAFLRADLVDRLRWITEQQLLDAVAVGQLTPGPVFTTATFLGYLIGGPAGALVATVGIFLPGFLLVAASGRLVGHLRRSPHAGAFLDGVNVASLALMAVVTWQLGRAAIVDVSTAAIAVASGVLLLRFNVSSVLLLLGGGAAGFGVLHLR